MEQFLEGPFPAAVDGRAALNAVWTAAWSALADTVSSIWDGITSVVRGAVNGIIRIINGMISAIVGGMNAVIGLLNGFSFDVPEFAQDALGTAKIGFNIDPITAPQIPIWHRAQSFRQTTNFLLCWATRRTARTWKHLLKRSSRRWPRCWPSGVGRTSRSALPPAAVWNSLCAC